MDATGDSAPRKTQEDMEARGGDGVEDGRPKLVGSWQVGAGLSPVERRHLCPVLHRGVMAKKKKKENMLGKDYSRP